jgi:tetratricopeptide (TPR) repeat protein
VFQKGLVMNLNRSKILICLVGWISIAAVNATCAQTLVPPGSSASQVENAKENYGSGEAQSSNFFGKDVTLSAPHLSKPVHSSNSEAPGLGATVPMKDFPTENKDDNLVLNSKYFCNEPDIKAAWREVCEQKAIHFSEPAYYYRKAAVLIQMGEYQKAATELKNLIADVPNNSDYHLAQAYCYFKLGMKTAARDEVGTARFHNPRLPANVSFQ